MGVVKWIKEKATGKKHDPKDFQMLACDEDDDLDGECVLNKHDVLRDGKVPHMVRVMFRRGVEP